MILSLLELISCYHWQDSQTQVVVVDDQEEEVADEEAVAEAVVEAEEEEVVVEAVLAEEAVVEGKSIMLLKVSRKQCVKNGDGLQFMLFILLAVADLVADRQEGGGAAGGGFKFVPQTSAG